MVGEHQFYLDACKKLGLEVVADETFADKDTDFSAQLTKIQAANPDVIAVAGLYQEGALIVKKAREMGMNQYVLAGNGFNSPEYIKQAGDARNSAIPWLRSATSKALPANLHSMKTVIRRWTSQSSKSRAASGYRSENNGRLFRYPVMRIYLG
ncbi:leucine ABC transporter subunit substrate-binding protein LivK [Bacteroides xylanisolvens]|nr:leucine ABC transporter subunit substrate-binding protein LivK [Bacteroides xylanisolvens]